MILAYGAAAAGSGHLKEGLHCQDYCQYVTLDNGWVVGCIADGVGSANHAEDGARIAVEHAVHFTAAHLLPEWNDDLLTALLRMAFLSAYNAIKGCSLKKDDNFFEYDTTLTMVVYNGRYFAWGHCGDGGIVAMDFMGDLYSPTSRQKGVEYNVVVPLRQFSRWQFGYSKEPTKALVLMTDGLYDLAVPYWMEPEPDPGLLFPFLQPKEMTDQNGEALSKELEELLQNGHYKSASDDKTLVGLVNIDEPRSTLYRNIVEHYRKRKKEKMPKLYDEEVEESSNVEIEVQTPYHPSQKPTCEDAGVAALGNDIQIKYSDPKSEPMEIASITDAKSYESDEKQETNETIFGIFKRIFQMIVMEKK